MIKVEGNMTTLEGDMGEILAEGDCVITALLKMQESKNSSAYKEYKEHLIKVIESDGIDKMFEKEFGEIANFDKMPFNETDIKELADMILKDKKAPKDLKELVKKTLKSMENLKKITENK